MRAPTRVVLADRTELVRNLLRVVCSRHGIDVVGETATARELVALCRAEHPHVAICDTALDDARIEDRIDDVLATGTRVVVLSGDPSPERLTSMLARGVSGYLLYDSSPDQVAEAVVAVGRGAAALHPTATGTILHQWRRLRAQPAQGERNTLTPREVEVLAAMADGLAAKAIARRLGVAPKTVENHKIRIFDKLGARSQAQAVALAIGHGLLPTAG